VAQSLANEFKTAMRRLATTVALVAAGQERLSWRGMAVTALTCVCVDPPILALCLNRESATCQSLDLDAPFSVNLLAQRHHALVPPFSGKSQGSERFSHGHWVHSRLGPPILADAAASLLCVSSQTTPVHSHLLVLGEVQQIVNDPTIDPLIWMDGMFAKAQAIPRPDAPHPR
jgi:flavin reductase